MRFTRQSGTATTATGTVGIGYGITTGGNNGGTTTTLTNTPNITLTRGDRLTATASSTGVVRFYVNDVLVASAQLVAPGWQAAWNTTGGQVGLRYLTGNNPGNSLRLDDFLGGNQ